MLGSVLAAVVTSPDWRSPRRFAYADETIVIGSGSGCTMVLAGAGIQVRQAVVYLTPNGEPAKLAIHGYGKHCGPEVNGQLVSGSMPLRDTDQVQIGSYTLTFHHVPPDSVAAHPPYIATDPIERSLLQGLADRDDASRSVYADWLEQRGDLARAELLRARDELHGMRPGDPEFAEPASRLAALAAKTDVAWRIQVASPPVENCTQVFNVRCAKGWSMLQPTHHPGVRRCTSCKRDVYYALSVGEARGFARQGHCVALDVTSARWPDDVGEPREHARCQACGFEIRVASRGEPCARCGYDRSDVMIGELNID